MKKEEYLKYNLPTEEASLYLEKLFDRNNELEEIFQILQPLLYKISGDLYGDDFHGDVTLAKLVEDFLKENEDEKGNTSSTRPTTH
jgi:hypothetical protein